MLPDNDEIPGLNCSRGMLRLSRFPARVSDQIAFLEEVAKKFGEGSQVHFVEPYDGYPGYIQVTPWSEVTKRPKIFGETVEAVCFVASASVT